MAGRLIPWFLKQKKRILKGKDFGGVWEGFWEVLRGRLGGSLGGLGEGLGRVLEGILGGRLGGGLRSEKGSREKALGGGQRRGLGRGSGGDQTKSNGFYSENATGL